MNAASATAWEQVLVPALHAVTKFRVEPMCLDSPTPNATLRCCEDVPAAPQFPVACVEDMKLGAVAADSSATTSDGAHTTYTFDVCCTGTGSTPTQAASGSPGNPPHVLLPTWHVYVFGDTQPSAGLPAATAGDVARCHEKPHNATAAVGHVTTGGADAIESLEVAMSWYVACAHAGSASTTWHSTYTARCCDAEPDTAHCSCEHDVARGEHALLLRATQAASVVSSVWCTEKPKATTWPQL